MKLNRRAFLKLSALGAAVLVAMRYVGAQAQTAARAVACVIMPGMEVPMAIPMTVGDDCVPAPTPEPSATATATPTLTATATASPTVTATDTVTATALPSATPTAAPTWRTWFPWVSRGR